MLCSGERALAREASVVAVPLAAPACLHFPCCFRGAGPSQQSKTNSFAMATAGACRVVQERGRTPPVARYDTWPALRRSIYPCLLVAVGRRVARLHAGKKQALFQAEAWKRDRFYQWRWRTPGRNLAADGDGDGDFRDPGTSGPKLEIANMDVFRATDSPCTTD